MLLAVVAVCVGVFLLTSCLRWRRSKADAGIDYQKQSVEIEGDERIHRSAYSPDKLVEQVVEEVTTLYEAFHRAAKKWGDQPCLGTFNGSDGYKWLTYSEVEKRSNQFRSGLAELGVPAGQDSKIGVYSQNRAEWVIVEQAANASSQPLVPLYDTFGPSAVAFIIKQAKISVVVCDEKKLPMLLEAAEELKGLKLVVKMENVSKEERSQFEKAGLTLMSQGEVEKRGEGKEQKTSPPQPDDVATLCYTSGTTGDPKGAILTHRNMIACLAGVYTVLERSNLEKPFFGPGDIHISFLPLAHMLERQIQLLMWHFGGRVGFSRGDTKKLTDDIKMLRPTIFAAVPRVYNRIYDTVKDKIEEKGIFAKLIFKIAMAAKKMDVKRRCISKDTIWDRLVFRKIQQQLGGRVKVMLTGAAPIGAECLTFLRCAFGCGVFEGYGTTETSAAACLTLYGEYKTDTVGPPLACNEIKLVDEKDMEYFAKNNQGEVCFRGPNVMQGYVLEKLNHDALDADGWLHSGDIGEWLPDGALHIIDRKKSMFKLAQGEYVAPEKIEGVYSKADFIAQLFVDGRSTEKSLVGIVIPERKKFPSWVQEHVSKAKAKDFKEMCKDPEVEKAVHEELLRLGKSAKLSSFEQVQAIRLHDEPFSVENELLTPTLKVKRSKIQQHFKEELDEMYENLHSSKRKEA